MPNSCLLCVFFSLCIVPRFADESIVLLFWTLLGRSTDLRGSQWFVGDLSGSLVGFCGIGLRCSQLFVWRDKLLPNATFYHISGKWPL